MPPHPWRGSRFSSIVAVRRGAQVASVAFEMMWMVRLALSRPYTFVVVSLVVAVMGVLSIMTMSVDIFPKINIPVVTSIWSYGGLGVLPTEMQDRITTIVERALTTTVNNIEHMESQSIRGNSVIKMFFQPGTDVNGSVAQGDGPQPDPDQAAAARDHATADLAIQRLRRAGDHAQSGQRSIVRDGDRRSRPKLHSHAAGGGAGGRGSPPVWRQDSCRERSTSTLTRSTRVACRRRTSSTPWCCRT